MINPFRRVRRAALKLYYGPSLEEILTHARVLPSSFTRELHAMGMSLVPNRPYCFHYNPDFEFYRLANIYRTHKSADSWSMQRSDIYSGGGPCMNIFLAKIADGEFLAKLDERGRELWLDAMANLPSPLRKELKYVTLILRDVSSIMAPEDEIKKRLKTKFPHLIESIPEGREILLERSMQGLFSYCPEAKNDQISPWFHPLHQEIRSAALEVLSDLQRGFNTPLAFPDMTLTRDDAQHSVGA